MTPARHNRIGAAVLLLGISLGAVSARSVAAKDRGPTKPPAPPAVHAVVPGEQVVLVARDRGLDLHPREGFADVDPPKPLGTLGLRATVYDALWWSATTVALATGSDGVLFVDVTDPAAPEALSRVETTGSARRLARLDDVLYVADEQGGVVVIDAGRTDRARVRRTVSTRGAVRTVDVLGGRLVTAEGSAGARVFDLATPDRPREIARLGRRVPAADAVFLDVATVLVTDGRGQLRAYRGDPGDDTYRDVAAPAALARVRTLSRTVVGTAFASSGVDGARALVANDQGVVVSGATMVLPRSLPAGRVTGLGDGVFAVAAGIGGVAIVDGADPENPVVVRPGQRGFEVRWAD
jgi:hypothetical protein